MFDLMAIDPGKRAIGVAFASDDRLNSAELVRLKGRNRNDLATDASEGGWCEEIRTRRVIIEYPRVYPGRGKVNPDDLLDMLAMSLIWAANATALFGTQYQFTRPAEWKGQTPKAVMHRRIRARLDEKEKHTLDKNLLDVPRAMQHNVLDAVGILLWGLGRL